jgi:hypothetical protein
MLHLLGSNGFKHKSHVALRTTQQRPIQADRQAVAAARHAHEPWLVDSDDVTRPVFSGEDVSGLGDGAHAVDSRPGGAGEPRSPPLPKEKSDAKSTQRRE